jgi:secondary thiamine-phosphate synthase enzyme
VSGGGEPAKDELAPATGRALDWKLNIANTTLTISTRGKGLYPFTSETQDWLSKQKASQGLLTVFIQHTSCSLVIQENADPDVTLDLRDFFERLVPESGEEYRHTAEGPDDMTSHIRACLTHTSIPIPVVAGRMALGTWQGLYLFEHRARPHQRRVVLQFMGE